MYIITVGQLWWQYVSICEYIYFEVDPTLPITAQLPSSIPLLNQSLVLPSKMLWVTETNLEHALRHFRAEPCPHHWGGGGGGMRDTCTTHDACILYIVTQKPSKMTISTHAATCIM